MFRKENKQPSHDLTDWLGQLVVDHLYISLAYIILCSLLTVYTVIRIYKKQIGISALIWVSSPWVIFYLLLITSQEEPKLWLSPLIYFFLVCGVVRYKTLEPSG